MNKNINNIQNNINFKNLSNINCELRNNYDTDYCENLNPNKIENFLKPYINYPFGNNNDLRNNKVFFDKNKFLLEEKTEIIKNSPKEICANKVIDKNYEGFIYKGDKNKCLLYNTTNIDEFNNNIENKYKNYNLETLFKTRNVADIKKYEDQQNSFNYFTKINNHKFIPKNKIDELDVSTKDQCMDSCVKDYPNCKSIVYLEEPKECTFFKKKIMNNKKSINNNYDIYSLKKQTLVEQNNISNKLFNDFNKNNELLDNNDYYCKLNNNKCYDDYKVNKNIEEEEILINDHNKNSNVLYNCSGIYSTNPFCTNKYDMKNSHANIQPKNNKYTKCSIIKEGNDLNKVIKIYNNKCKQEFGQEYVYDNDKYDIESVVDCDYDNGNIGKTIKCKLNFDNTNLNIGIEKFSNGKNSIISESSDFPMLLDFSNFLNSQDMNRLYYNKIYISLLIFAIFWLIFLLFLFQQKS
jgi:hypothetical protein